MEVDDDEEDEKIVEGPESETEGMIKGRVGTAHLAKKQKQKSAKAAFDTSPAGTKHSHEEFLKILSSTEQYQQSLALIKYAVSNMLLS